MDFSRCVVAGFAVLLLPILSLAESPLMSLKNAAPSSMLIGAAVSPKDFDDPRVASLLAEQFNSLVAGNDFKPDHLQREQGKFTFGQADRIADFAAKHNMKMIGHTLLWHNQAPAWLFEDSNKKPLPREQALANLKAHIDTVVKHFGDKVLGWDVVNEAISDRDDEYLRDTPARRAIGDDYILKAFEFAHAANPNVELYYNDYNIELPAKRAKTIRLIKELQAGGARVDAVGIQGHWMLEFPEAKVIDDAIKAFSELGVKVLITELDVDVLPRKNSGADITATEKSGLDPYTKGLPDEIQQKLAARYAEIFGVIVKHQKVITRVTFWGIHDGTSWLNFFPVRGRTNHPMLWDRGLNPKPAFRAVVETLASAQNAKP